MRKEQIFIVNDLIKITWKFKWVVYHFFDVWEISRTHAKCEVSFKTMNGTVKIILLALATTDAHSRLRLSNSLNITKISKIFVDKMMKATKRKKNLFFFSFDTKTEYKWTLDIPY